MTEYEYIFNEIELFITNSKEDDKWYVPEIRYKNYTYYNVYAYKHISTSFTTNWAEFHRDILDDLTIASRIDKELHRYYIEDFIKWYINRDKI